MDSAVSPPPSEHPIYTSLMINNPVGCQTGKEPNGLKVKIQPSDRSCQRTTKL